MYKKYFYATIMIKLKWRLIKKKYKLRNFCLNVWRILVRRYAEIDLLETDMRRVNISVSRHKTTNQSAGQWEKKREKDLVCLRERESVCVCEI